ncbi:hypothetical protein F2P81_006422 [Scophthalmus maximus]|uniref:Uncharacterized protein n=1 Tax=Scophthalmus maximus TaxID=52904 RepID=A0A6A4TBI3_SCOMX|nr:hypothetical protein F2P81_006422 [Scophthalmus maximus]
MKWMNAEEMLRRAEAPLFWVGAFTVASLALWMLYRLLSGFRIWVLGNGQLLSPKLGKWAEEQFNVETRTIAVDFGKTDIYTKIEAGLAGLEIGVLVNNVGVSYPYPEYFLHIPDLDNFITNLINVNMTSVCQMTRLVLPRMAERSKGVILNISSASGMYPVPLLTVYSATKSVLPFFVATKMTRIRKPTLDKPTPERYVAAELTTVGLQSQTNGYFPHAVMGWLTTKLVPISLVIFFGARMNRLQRTGYLQRRKLREQKNGGGFKTD